MISPKRNPIIIHEMRGRMRGRRAFLILSIYLILMSCMAGSVYAFVYSENVSSSAYNLSSPTIQYGPVIGKSIFTGTVLLLLTIISFIAPGFTAGAIAGEKERQTYETLLLTPLRPAQIVWGKLGSVMSFLMIMIFASLPIQSLAFLFGGVALEEVIIAAIGLFVTALVFGAMGLYISSFTPTTMIAIIVAYSIGIPFIYGLPFILFYFISALGGGFAGLPGNFPEIGLVILMYGFGLLLSLNPFGAASLTALAAADGQGYFLVNIPLGSTTVWFLSPWIIYVLFHSCLTLGFLYLTTRRVAKISHK
ncbi:MAG: ABC transporter permease subunit [Chloroflexota bacterium]